MSDVWVGRIEPVNNSPVLDYCRKLIKERTDPSTSLEVYRGDLLSFVIPNIGVGAAWKVEESIKKGPRLKKYVPFSKDKLGIVGLT